MIQASVKIREPAVCTRATTSYLDEYVESRQSAAFPFLVMTEMERFLNLRTGESETALIRRFRAWVRQQIAYNWGQ